MSLLKNIEHGIKAMVFNLLKSFLKKGSPELFQLDGHKMHKILFLRPEKIGDMLSTFPVIDALKNNFPHLKISILASPKNIALIKNDPRFDKIYIYHKRIWRDLFQLRQIRKENYDCVIDMICNDSVTALLISQYCVKDCPRIGVEKVKYGGFYDFKFNNNSDHIIDNTLETLTAFGINPASASGFAPPYIGKKDFKLAEDYFDQYKTGHPLIKKIGFNLSAGSPTRILSNDKLLEIISPILALNNDYHIFLFTTPGERGRAEEIMRNFKSRVNLIPQNMNLIQASALISKLDIMISPDTSLIHIARSLQIPVIGLYSQCQWNLLWWHPYKQREGAVLSSNNDNIHDISVDRILTTFESVMLKKVASEGK